MHSEPAGLTADERDSRPRAVIGRMPSDWQLATVGDLFRVQQGKPISPGARSGPNPRPFLRTANVLWGRLALSHLDEMSFSPEEAERLALQPDDLLVCEGGEIGRAAIWSGEVAGCLIQNHVHRLRASTTRVVPRFIMYWLRAAFLHLGVYEGVGNKTTIPNLSAARVKQLPIPLPSRAEQLGIASVLDHLDRRYQLEESRLASLRTLKAATMAKLFREGLRNEPLQETEAGLIPNSWSCRPLGDLLEIAQYGLSLPGGPSGRVPILRMNCQDESRVRLDDLQYVDLDREALARFRLDRGDLLFNRTNSFELVGRTAIFDSDVEAVFASYLIRLRTNSKAIAPRFLNYYLNLFSTQQALKAFATRGVSQSNISASKLRLLKIPVPPLVEQEQIADHLDCGMREIELTKERLGRQEALFATVLSTLMTGAIRLLPTLPEIETLDVS